MSRSRVISGDTSMDEDLASVSIWARYFFVLLWGHADRQGRAEASSKVLKAKILPWDNANVDKILEELESKFIFRYNIDGKPYLQIKNFLKYQHVHPREAKSKIPPPPGIVDAETEKPSMELSKLASAFAKFSAAYPKMTGHADACRAYDRLNPDAALQETILAAIAKQKNSAPWNKGMIHSPKKWIEGKHWLDVVGQAAAEDDESAAGQRKHKALRAQYEAALKEKK